MLRRGEPLPVDLQVKLLNMGYSVKAMEEIYGR
jgi:hypothetical protein